MKIFAIAMLAALLVPSVAAAPNAQTGTQSGYYWSEATAVAVQGNTNFALVGVAGDHDILFLDATGWTVGFFIACGPDRGRVPATAVTGLVLVWDHDSIPGTCIAAGVSPSSQFVYVDGF